jgi:excisionase family DNA binding protein
MPVLKEYYPVEEAAVLLDLHPETIKRLCRSRRLQAVKIHSTWLIHKADLSRFKATYHENRGRRPLERRSSNFNEKTKKPD